MFLDSMERQLSQEYINIPEEDIRCQIEVLDRGRPGKFSSSVQVSSSGLTTMTSNFGRSYLLRSNSNFDVLGLYGKQIESRIHSYF